MDTSKFKSLNTARGRLQGSLNYWTNAAHAMTQNAAKARTGKNRETVLVKLAYCQQKANAAKERLDKVKEELTNLDPDGSLARQAHAAQTNRDKAKREIKLIEEHLAKVDQDTKEHEYLRSRLDKKRQRLAVLEEQLDQFRVARVRQQPRENERPQADADTLAILERIKTWNNEAGSQPPAAEALTPLYLAIVQASVGAALAPVLEGLRHAITLATLEGNPKLVEQLQSSLDHLCEVEVKKQFASETPPDHGGQRLQ